MQNLWGGGGGETPRLNPFFIINDFILKMYLLLFFIIKDLKLAVADQKKFGNVTDYDLSVSDPHTKEVHF